MTTLRPRNRITRGPGAVTADPQAANRGPLPMRHSQFTTPMFGSFLSVRRFTSCHTSGSHTIKISVEGASDGFAPSLPNCGGNNHCVQIDELVAF